MPIRMTTLSLLLAVGAIASLPPNPPSEQATMIKFMKWYRMFNKTFEASEFGSRYKVFQANWMKILKHNAESHHTYKLGLNAFSDLSAKEFNAQRATGFQGRLKLAKLSKGISSPKKKTHSPLLKQTKLAASVDWVSAGAVTPIKDQGLCGDCWAFSSTGAIEGLKQIEKGSLVSLSEQQLCSCSSQEGDNGCNGGLMDNAFQYIVDNGGICSESAYPYENSQQKTTITTCGASDCSPVATISGYTDVSPGSESALMEAVAQQPVSVAIEADSDVFQSYSSGILSSSACGTNLDHAVLVVGYGTSNGQDYWMVKNQWGTSWGDEGYVYIERGAGGNGICGILSAPSVPYS